MRQRLFVLAIVLLAACATMQAQPVWTAPPMNHALTFEWQRPALHDVDNANFFNSGMFLSYKLRTSESLTLLIDIPFANYSIGDRSEFALGNPFVGLAFGKENSVITGDVGARAPISDEDKWRSAAIGVLTDLDRFDAYGANFVPVDATLRLHSTFPTSDFGIRAHFGTTVKIFTIERDDTFEVFARYGAMGTYKNDVVLAQIGFSGIFNLSDDKGDFSENADHQLVLSANANVGANVWPGILLKVPLDEPYNDAVDMVLCINVMVGLP